MPRRIFRSRANQLAQEPESLVMMARSGSRGDSSQVDALRIDRRRPAAVARSSSVFHQFRDVVFDASAPAAVGLLLQPRQQGAQRLGGIADQADLHRKADRQHAGIDIDLHAARLAFLRQEFGIGKGRADHQQRVAFHHQVVARLGAEQADRAGDPRQIVGQRRLAEQRLGAAGGQAVGDRDHFVGGAAARRRRPASRPSCRH